MSYDYKKHWENSIFSAMDIGPGWEAAIEKNLIPGSVLDIGCGTGRFYQLFKGQDYMGVDISPEAIEVAKGLHSDKFQVIDVVLEDIHGAFANVFTWTVLEHIPPEHIKQVVEKLKRWGKNVLIVEPQTTGEHAAHCFSHDYESMGFERVEDLGSVKMFRYQKEKI